jgi:hypothetical protein
MKRFRAEQSNKQRENKAKVNTGPGPGPAPPAGTSYASKSTGRSTRSHVTVTNTNNSTSAFHDYTSHFTPVSAPSDLQIDPSLLLAASDPSVLLEEPAQTTNPRNQPAHSPHPQHSQQTTRPQPSPAPLKHPPPPTNLLPPSSLFTHLRPAQNRLARHPPIQQRG